MKKIEEDYAEYKIRTKMEREKEVKKLKEESNRWEKQCREDNQRWEIKF